MKGVFRYLKGNRNRGLLYKSTVKDITGPWIITIWVDSDYDTDPDTRKSRGGILDLPSSTKSHNSTLQRGPNQCKVYHGLNLPATAMDGEPMSTVATGTCGVEYMTLGVVVKELIWLYMLIKTMNINVQKPCIVYEDNRACIKIAENATAMKRTKHIYIGIYIGHHLLREHVENGTIKIVPVTTAEKRADIMTKMLDQEVFIRFRDRTTSAVDSSDSDNPSGST